jgi:hypothetical protein
MKRLVRLLLLLACLAESASVARAASLDSDVIALFPKDVRQFSYADLKQARQFPWYPQLEAQILPVRLADFQQFLTAQQMGAGTHIDEVAWATLAPGSGSAGGASGIAGVAIGQFDEGSAESFMNSQNIPRIEVENVTVYESTAGLGADAVFFCFLDSNTVLFGSRAQVARLIGVHERAEANLLQNQAMFQLIGQVNGDAMFWGVFSPEASVAAVAILLPGASGYSQAKALLGRMDGLAFSVENSSDTDMGIDFKVVCASPEDALLFSQVAQASIFLRRYQSRSDDPALAKALESERIAPTGNQFDISIDLTHEELLSLIEHNILVSGT